MNRYSWLLLASTMFLCAAALKAAETGKPAAVAPADASAPAATEPTAAPPAVEPEAEPGETPSEATPKGEAVKAPELKPAAAAKAAEEKPTEKPLQASAAKLAPVVDSYQKAHDEFLAWLKSSSEKLAEVDQKVEGLKAKITANEAQITKLKMDSAQAGGAQTRALEDQTKGLWSQLKDERQRQAQMSKALGRAAEQKVKELDGLVSDAVQKASAQLR